MRAEREDAASDPTRGLASLGGRYRLRRAIGSGGTSIIHLAEHERTGGPVAIKRLTAAAMLEPSLVRRFAREARGTARLRHPNIVEVSDVGETDAGVPYLVMEYLDGEHLGHTLAREGPMAWPRVAKLARQIASALAQAHARGIVHRDLKLENCVRITRGGDVDFVKLIDFGVASFDEGERMTEVGKLVGTPQYLAPEAIEGERVDHRADVYALGVVMFELLTGEVPFDDPQLMEILTAHRYDPVPSLASVRPGIEHELPRGAEAIVRRALQKRPEDRFPDMQALIAALDRVATGQALELDVRELEPARPRRPARARSARRRGWLHRVLSALD